MPNPQLNFPRAKKEKIEEEDIGIRMIKARPFPQSLGFLPFYMAKGAGLYLLR